MCTSPYLAHVHMSVRQSTFPYNMKFVDRSILRLQKLRKGRLSRQIGDHLCYCSEKVKSKNIYAPCFCQAESRFGWNNKKEKKPELYLSVSAITGIFYF